MCLLRDGRAFQAEGGQLLQRQEEHKRLMRLDQRVWGRGTEVAAKSVARDEPPVGSR